MLPVLFYLNIFSLFFFPLISLHGRAAARTITTATESGANLLETKDDKEHPLTSPPLRLGFLGQECSRMSSGTTQLWAQQFSWHRAGGSCFPMAHVLIQDSSLSSSKQRHLACPFPFLQLPPPASATKRRAATWGASLSPLMSAECLSDNKALDWTVASSAVTLS